MKALSFLVVLLLTSPAWAADNITVKDAGGNNIVLRCHDVGSGVQSCQLVIGDASGNVCVNTPGTVGACHLPVIVEPGNGSLTFRNPAANASNQDALVVHSGAATLWSILVANTASTPAWAQFYDLTSCSSASTAKYSVPIPGNTALGGAAPPLPVNGMSFATGICVRLTLDMAGSNASNVTPGTAIVEGTYD